MSHVKISGADSFRIYGPLSDADDQYVGEYLGTKPGQWDLGDAVRRYAEANNLSVHEAGQRVAGAELDRMTKSAMAGTMANLTYEQAFVRVSHAPENVDLFNLWAGTGTVA